MNNKNALDKKKSPEQKQSERFDLKKILCDKKYNDSSNEHYEWIFKQPWVTFVPDAKEKLQQVVVSFKQNQRVINKMVNQHTILKEGKKELVKQQKGQNWAIRKPLHKDTVSGLISLQKKKTVSISTAIDNPQNIVDKLLKEKIQKLIAEGYDKKGLIKYLKENVDPLDEQGINKTEIYYWENNNVASRTSLDTSFSKAKIESISDSGIQSILLRHLSNNDDNPEIAFSPEGIEEMNKNIVNLNNGKRHQPILKVRTYETKGNKFAVGQTGNKRSKFVEAAKGTNLFFAIYADAKGKRDYDTIPLNIVIERQKQGLISVPETNEAGHRLLMYLSPNDLVYLPTDEEGNAVTAFNINGLNQQVASRIYKTVSSSTYQCFFIRHDVASSIVNKMEFSALNKMEKSIDGKMIKDSCIKLAVDRLGNIKPKV